MPAREIRLENPKRRTTPKELPVISEEKTVDIITTMEMLQRRYQQIKRNFELLRKNYPQEIDSLLRQYPAITTAVRNLTLVDKLIPANISREEMLSYVALYNRAARIINRDIKLYAENSTINPVVAVAEIVVQQATINALSEDDKRELVRFGQDLYKQIFPESHTDRLVRAATGQAQLDDYQKYLLMPANAFESVGKGIYDLFTPEGWRNLSQAINTLKTAKYEDYKTAWEFLKLQYDGLSTTDKVVPVVTFVLSVVVLVGGISRITQIARAAQYSTNLVRILTALAESGAVAKAAIHTASPAVKVVPAAALAGLGLQYINLPKNSN